MQSKDATGNSTNDNDLVSHPDGGATRESLQLLSSPEEAAALARQRDREVQRELRPIHEAMLALAFTDDSEV